MSSAAQIWRVRPAQSSGQGQAVSWPRLAASIEREEVGDLDEVLGPGEQQWSAVSEHPVAGGHLPSARRVSRRGPEDAEADMTPMIDVTFQLLIFFMIAATYTVQKTLDLPSTKPSEEGASTVTMEQLESENIVVKIAGDGTVSLADKVVPLADVEATIRDAASKMKSAELVLDVDDQAVHDVVVQVIDAAGAAQIEKVLFVSRVGPSAAAP